jgi:hypothetical protein
METTIHLTWFQFYAIVGVLAAFGLGLSVHLWRVADRLEKAAREKTLPPSETVECITDGIAQQDWRE